MPKLESGVAYYGNGLYSDGYSTYEGRPCPTKEVYDLIGEEGVAEVHNILQKVILFRKVLNGDGNLQFYGLSGNEGFAHYPSKRLFRAFDPFQTTGKPETNTGIRPRFNTDESRDRFIKLHYPKEKFQFPELLKFKNHYYIDVSGKFVAQTQRQVRNAIKLFQAATDSQTHD